MKTAKTNAADAGNQAFDEKDPDSPGSLPEHLPDDL
jgi:hypothetical protein